MKTILVPTQNTPTMQSTLETAVLLAQRTGAYIEGVPRRSACLESADTVAKVGNRTTLKISRKLILGCLYGCNPP
jgi:hypothetical protein